MTGTTQMRIALIGAWIMSKNNPDHSEHKWQYAFNCRDCGNLKYVKDEIRDGMYCVPLMNKEKIMHADDDYIVRCDSFRPLQHSLFEGR